MQLEVGAVLEGKVTGITKFGAFVELPEGHTGMVHISEIAPTFVQDIHEFVSEGQTVKVKVLNITEEGKISLSMKRLMAPQQGREGQGAGRPRQSRPPRPQRPHISMQSAGRPGNFEWQPRSAPESASFEDMMSHFKQTSDEKISDLKRVTENKRGGGGGFSHRGGSKS
ncbi:S1 RNA-binding domain-containing protein [Caproicibacterium sp. BJN0003]|uniref:S1 RNA-binding domain-containing protein n=1 Tax=Caproicibacterium sp. BJN0003 TaxID=2994078 RepID=UPI00224CB21D|nr:S1 RNA-binding domain-containing protein [Caproicibacterium sp. BJN0003]UZT82769.1 S1 RNA-binding domain-containing protein [Caproicibacterium sp. BJN0003]